MKIINITPGFGNRFYCGNCFHDSRFPNLLRSAGHVVESIPLYLPLSIGDETDKNSHIFYGAINIFLKEKIKFLRKMPNWLKKIFNSPFLLKMAARKAGSTRAEGLEGMTISMLEGSKGAQAEELKELITYLKQGEKPDIIHLSNSLLIGMAEDIRKELEVPIICSLQDEDVWINAMRPHFKNEVWELMSQRAEHVDCFVSVSNYFAEIMQQHLNLPDEKMEVVYIGVDPDRYDLNTPVSSPSTIGFLSRTNQENGFELLIDAFIKLKQDPEYKDIELKISGGMTSDDKKFVHEQVRKVKKQHLLKDIEFIDTLKSANHKELFSKVSLLSVPVLDGEAFGVYMIEAMASGIPVVQPEIGAFPELVKLTKGGELYSPNTPRALSDKWKELLNNNEKLIKMGKAGRESIKKELNAKLLTDKMINIYKKSIERFNIQSPQKAKEVI